MIIIDCPHCKMRIALARSTARLIVEQMVQEEARMMLPASAQIPLVNPCIEAKGEIEPGDTDLEFLRGIGVKP